jgi:DNA-binding MarR family transcriptional regulator
MLTRGAGGSRPAGRVHETRVRLELLGAIAESRGVTQRDLAARLGIALGLTNALIRRLARDGYIKVAHVSPRRVRYLLTAKGLLEKSRLTYSYIRLTTAYYRDLRARLQAVFDGLLQEGARRIVLCGAGEVAEVALICAQGLPLEVVAVVDHRRAGGTLLGRPVAPLETLPALAFDALILTAAVPPERFAARFRDLGIAPSKIRGLEDGGRGPAAPARDRLPVYGQA